MASTVLHWLLSQSIFLISVDSYRLQFNNARTPVQENNFITCGYSPIAIIFTIIAGGLMFIATLLLGRRRFSSGMPVASNCSAAIAAACHPPIARDAEPLALKKLKWGEVDMIGRRNAKYCAFLTEENVIQPTAGVFYSGNRKGVSGGYRRRFL
jgi:hypothetical protein